MISISVNASKARVISKNSKVILTIAVRKTAINESYSSVLGQKIKPVVTIGFMLFVRAHPSGGAFFIFVKCLFCQRR